MAACLTVTCFLPQDSNDQNSSDHDSNEQYSSDHDSSHHDSNDQDSSDHDSSDQESSHRDASYQNSSDRERQLTTRLLVLIGHANNKQCEKHQKVYRFLHCEQEANRKNKFILK